MSEWKKCTLGDVLNLRRGYDLPHSKMMEGNIPVAGSNGIIGTHNIATPIDANIFDMRILISAAVTSLTTWIESRNLNYLRTIERCFVFKHIKEFRP